MKIRHTGMESSIIILNSFNGNFYFSNPARNNNPVRILVMQHKTLHLSLPLRIRRVNVTMNKTKTQHIVSLDYLSK